MGTKKSGLFMWWLLCGPGRCVVVLDMDSRILLNYCSFIQTCGMNNVYNKRRHSNGPVIISMPFKEAVGIHTFHSKHYLFSIHVLIIASPLGRGNCESTELVLCQDAKKQSFR